MRRVSSAAAICAAVTCAALGAGCAEWFEAPTGAPAQPRPISFEQGGQFVGNGIAYGPFRDGQGPDGAQPTRAQIAEDVALMKGRWSLLRLYSSDETAQLILEVLRDQAPGMKVMLGTWVAPEKDAAVAAANRKQTETAIRLANAFPQQVLAINVGNETQVSWTPHKVPREQLIAAIREVRSRTTVPVTTADDYAFWLERRAGAVAREVDFLAVHAYAMWGGAQLDEALAFTQRKLAEVRARHPGRPLVLAEYGWATQKHTEGDQATRIRGAPGEPQQAAAFRELTGWTAREKIPNFWFEAFDENWKGGTHPNEVEKHWGLFRADRSRKQALQDR